MMVQRKDSLEFLLILKGAYETSHLFILLKGLTEKEIDIVERCVEDKNLFIETMRNTINGYRNYSYSISKFNENKFLIKRIINKLRYEEYPHPQLLWEWPKGIANSREEKLTCAYREFKEEVGFDIPDDITNIIELSKCGYSVFSCKNINIIYWLILCESEIEVEKVKKNDEEVFNRGWKTEEEIKELLAINRDIIPHKEPARILACINYQNLLEECNKYIVM